MAPMRMIVSMTSRGSPDSVVRVSISRVAVCSATAGCVAAMDGGTDVGAVGAGGELQVDLVQPVLAATGVHLDAEVDLRLVLGGAQRVRRARVLHRQVADELGQDADAGLAAIGVPAFGGCVTIDFSAGVGLVSLPMSGTGRRRAGIAANACSSACAAPRIRA